MCVRRTPLEQSRDGLVEGHCNNHSSAKGRLLLMFAQVKADQSGIRGKPVLSGRIYLHRK